MFSTTSQVTLNEVRFPELGNHCIDTVVADVFHLPSCQYDIIVGRDILNKIGMKIDFHNKTVSWMNQDLPMRVPSSFNQFSIDNSEQLFLQEEEEDYILFEAYADNIIIKDRKYQAVLPEEVVNQLDHLDKDQR